MSKYRLICNADDFGMSWGITDAIINCHVNGIITSTSLMANMPAAEYACLRAKDVPSLAVGIHLTLTEGRPITSPERVPDLVDEQGQFLQSDVQRKRLWWGRRVAEQVEREFAAQIERVLTLGITPTHCDSHHGIHKMPIARAAMIKVLKKFNILCARTHVGYYWTRPSAPIKIRLKRIYRNTPLILRATGHRLNHWLMRRSKIRTPERKLRPSMLIPSPFDPKQQILATLDSLPPGAFELVFHPGYPDPDVTDPSDFQGVRDIDTALARDLEIKAAFEKHHIELISFAEL